MKQIRSVLFFLMVAMLNVAITSCKNQNTDSQTAEDSLEKDFLLWTNSQTLAEQAIEEYLVNEIGSQYTHGEVCIPHDDFLVVDAHDTMNYIFWGDWWVFNYNIVGDTLKTVSGGNHPGKILVKRTPDGYQVVSFDQVEDGSGNVSSAKRIFGQYYDAFHAVNSNQALRDSTRLAMVADYVKQHDVQAAYLQDYGWPAVEIGQ